jgi:hypothetical protein
MGKVIGPLHGRFCTLEVIPRTPRRGVGVHLYWDLFEPLWIQL